MGSRWLGCTLELWRGRSAAPSDPTPHAVAGALLVSLGGGRSDLGAVILTISGGTDRIHHRGRVPLVPEPDGAPDFRAIVVGNLVTGAIVKYVEFQTSPPLRGTT